MDPIEAIADPTRRRIVEMLAERDLAVGELVKAFEMTGPAISQHLQILRHAGLVNSRAEAQTRIQSLNPDGLRAMSAWLARTMGFWNRRLDALEQALLADDAAQLAAMTHDRIQPAKKKS